MKAIATYLPQYHRIKENDEFWGEGFTDWVAVKGAQPMFPGHRQPRVPLERNYYDLLDINNMRKQADLMHEYEIDGFCFHHYYFENGHKVLEKPVENLLVNKDIDIPFFLCWDNESWVRSWSRISGTNSWADRYDQAAKRTEKEYLLKQDYGKRKEWAEHFEYLLKFFEDDRYIKLDGKPVFWIYSAYTMPCIREMTDYWRELAVEAGFPGMYFIGTHCNNGEERILDGSMTHEPVCSMLNLRNTVNKETDLPYIIDYDVVWQSILLEDRQYRNQTYYEAFVDYDDTPRRGSNGTCITGSTPEKFKMYLTELFAKNEAVGAEFTIINAWNEWGESMYLEPDEIHGDEYLRAVSYAKGHYKEKVSKYKVITSLYDDINKLNDYLDLFESWMELRHKGSSFSVELIAQGIREVAVYGYSRFGRQLASEFAGTEVSIKYFIDRSTDVSKDGVEVYSPEDDLPVCDAVIVAAPYYFDNIREKLMSHGFERIISLEDLIKNTIKRDWN